MPTYICRGASLTDEDRSALARAITHAHSDVTGADAFFAQVLFEDLLPGRCFLGGRPLEGPHFYVHGHIRAGRSPEDRGRLVARIIDAATRRLSIPADAVWVYISELPPRAMVEYGVALPEPGDEARWLDRLPDATRHRLTGR